MIAKIDEAIHDLQQGKMLIVVDDENRENEGDLIVAAEFTTPENMNFMIKNGSGIVCLAMEPAMVTRLALEAMPRRNAVGNQAFFMQSIEARVGVTTGVSARDRMVTVKAAINPNSSPNDIVTPGHMFPLRAVPGGVLERAGHTEAGVDLARLAGLIPAAVICEVMNIDGTMSRLPDLIPFAQKHDIKIITIQDLIAYRRQHEVSLAAGKVA
jgi:3,4-dihydroxy 2-butanone 4-phosphate synthase/GTP cyclohydrolase II